MLTKFLLNKERGITLIELLLVTAVSIILITGFFILIDPMQKIAQSNDGKRKAELSQLQRTLEIYYQDKGKYPTSSGNYKIIDNTERDWDTTWSPYMAKLPKDPTAGHNYVYFSPVVGACPNNQCYFIYANLQRGAKDPQACKTIPCPNATANGLGTRCGSGNVACNFGMTSPNTTP